MKNQWIRLYRAALHNPKIVTLSDRQHRAWHNCLLMAGDSGALPSMRDIAVHMRVSVPDAMQLVNELVEAGLIDAESLSGPTTFKMHQWGNWQYVSDTSKERTRKYRKRRKEINGDGVVTSQERQRDNGVTPPDTDTDTDSEQNPPQKRGMRGKFVDHKRENAIAFLDALARAEAEQP